MWPTTAGATDRLAELLVHGVLAALVVVGLVHWIPVVAPSARYAHRFSALAAPIVLGIVFAAWLPFRDEPWFQDRSLFVSDRWDLIRVGGVSVRGLAVWAAGALGVVLLARDARAALRDAARTRPRQPLMAAVPADLEDLVGGLARLAGVDAPALEMVVAGDHVLHCRGVWRPRILVSTSTLAALRPDQLRAAFAHEIAHVAHRDVARGWVLFVLRTFQCFNPIAQAVGRRAVQELEWRADDRAARLTGAPLALAHALVRCARNRGDRFLGLSGRGRLRSLEERCRRLMDAPPAGDDHQTLSLVLLWAVLGGLMVLVQ
jgi:Zn-dependent protease with chaperone function